MTCDGISCVLGIYFWKLATVFLGAFVAWTAFRQYQIARDKLKLDLFEKRFAVFEGTRKFLSKILREGTATTEDVFIFRAATVGSEFLFKADIVEYLSEIDTRALKQNAARESFEPLPVGEERSRLVKASSDELGWLTGQLSELTIRFGPYMSFSE